MQSTMPDHHEIRLSPPHNAVDYSNMDPSLRVALPPNLSLTPASALDGTAVVGSGGGVLNRTPSPRAVVGGPVSGSAQTSPVRRSSVIQPSSSSSSLQTQHVTRTPVAHLGSKASFYSKPIPIDEAPENLVVGSLRNGLPRRSSSRSL